MLKLEVKALRGEGGKLREKLGVGKATWPFEHQGVGPGQKNF